jgi:hypothetical protein
MVARNYAPQESVLPAERRPRELNGRNNPRGVEDINWSHRSCASGVQTFLALNWRANKMLAVIEIVIGLSDPLGLGFLHALGGVLRQTRLVTC